MFKFKPCILILLLVGVTHLPAQPAGSLKKTVKRFTKVIADSTKDVLTYQHEIIPYLDPASNRDSLAVDYTNYWINNRAIHSFPLSTRIVSIKVTSDKSTGIVQIANKWHMPSGEIYYFKSQTNWIKKNGVWYRTGDASIILEKRKL